MRSSENSRIVANTQGAIFIEFLFVVLPFMIILLGLAQTALMYLGGMAVKRSAATAARAAMVVFDDDPKKYGGQGRNTLGGQREEAIKMAAAFPIFAIHTSPKKEENVRHALRAWGDSPYKSKQTIPDGLRVEFPGGVSGSRASSITVKVSYDYPCEVPVVRAIMCPGGTVEISAQSTLPNHAANYTYGSW
jgi:hypothetical protein